MAPVAKTTLEGRATPPESRAEQESLAIPFTKKDRLFRKPSRSSTLLFYPTPNGLGSSHPSIYIQKA
ncbi:hypothetical protein DSO57_1012976 [Entomophthora muscae]|uniref:Uncharacterized protein n=1 Tax=Entomophthora muscae TaxID=34485 RepID=A0ACC2TGN3_9FUNG|nr:hypothetical protein DSO57_1012976 [Entomophthora muscae]